MLFSQNNFKNSRPEITVTSHKTYTKSCQHRQTSSSDNCH